MDGEKLTGISAKVDVERIQSRLKEEFSEQSKQLQGVISDLFSKDADVEERIKAIEKKLCEIDEMIQESLKWLG